ncbi:MAG: hypothetical protein IJ048_01370, partial [Clostridia bacterium]|nr:hypothetical protein [Clostridia bacterium]
MTDMHVSRMFPEAALERLLAQAKALDADIVCLGGDFAETEADQALAVRLLETLRPRLGAFAVLGNNDFEHFYHSARGLRAELLRAGIVTLVDTEVRLDLPGGASLRVAGLNALPERTQPAAPLFAGTNEGEFRLLLAHYPKSILLHLDDCAAPPHLALAGHTHGGQFRFLGLTPYSIGFEWRKTSRALPVSGWTEEPGFPMLISPGVGTSRLPFRLNVPPAIHLITIQAKTQSELDKT